jgi:pimeloyl-ACP methyl ester carboxylesterase
MLISPKIRRSEVWKLDHPLSGGSQPFRLGSKNLVWPMRKLGEVMKLKGTVRSFAGVVCATALVGGLTGAIAPVAPAATAFEPKLSYYKCPAKSLPVGVQCAKLTVPLDWQIPNDGRTTTIDVRVKRSKEGKGGLTFNPGGPGGSGIDSFPSFYSLLPDEVVSRFDFVGWDPRGVGGSGLKLKGCQYSAPVPQYPPATGPVNWQMYWQQVADRIGADNAACLAANPDSAPYLGTWQVIRDLDALRAALGYSTWNYWGMSYGTRIGHAYARTFPHKLRAMIMDGSVMANESTYRNGTSFPANYWVSLQLFPSLAAPSAARKITFIEEYLNDTVVVLPDGIEFTRWDWAEQFRNLLVAQSQYPYARAMVNNLYAGITAATPAERAKGLEVVANISEALRLNIDKQMSDMAAVLIFVNCSDLHDRPTASQLAVASESAERNYGTTQPYSLSNSAACFGLNPDDLSPAIPSGAGMITLKTPPVFVLSSGDAATPWVWGRSLANTFVGSSTVTYESTQHVAYLTTPSDCVNAPVTKYLVTLTMPSRHRQCSYSPGGPVLQR